MDYLGVLLSLAGMWLLPTRYRLACILSFVEGLALFIVSNFVWAWYGLQGGVWSIVGLQAVFLGLNVRAWRRGTG